MCYQARTPPRASRRTARVFSGKYGLAEFHVPRVLCAYTHTHTGAQKHVYVCVCTRALDARYTVNETHTTCNGDGFGRVYRDLRYRRIINLSYVPSSFPRRAVVAISLAGYFISTCILSRVSFFGSLDLSHAPAPPRSLFIVTSVRNNLRLYTYRYIYI